MHRGSFLDFQKQELTLWDARNSLDLVAIGLWSDRALADILQTLQLPRGTVLQAAGKARWENDRLSQIRLELRSDFIPLRSLPIFSKIPAAMLEVPVPFAATAILQDRIFTLSPITAGSQEKPLSGSASWEMETRRFNGQIELGTSVWKADSVLPEIQWQASNDPASVAK